MSVHKLLYEGRSVARFNKLYYYAGGFHQPVNAWLIFADISDTT
jgi:hypothetical protein